MPQTVLTSKDLKNIGTNGMDININCSLFFVPKN